MMFAKIVVRQYYFLMTKNCKFHIIFEDDENYKIIITCLSLLHTANLPGLPVELQNTQFGSAPILDASSLGQFGSSGFPYFGQSAGAQQPSYYPYFDAPGLSEEELKAFAAKLASDIPLSGQVLAGTAASPEVNIPQGTSISNPSAEIAALIESGNKAKSQDKAVVTDEKPIAADSPSPSPSPLPNTPKTQAKFNSVQIIQNDPFNGQLPLL